MLSGYVFWFVLSKITTTEIIGVTSTLVSFASIFITVSMIGIPTGVQRFLGKSFSEGKLEDAKVYVKSSLFLTTVGIVASSILILVIRNWIYDTFKIDSNLLIVSILLIGSSVITTLLRSVVFSTLNTKTLPLIMTSSASSKVILAIILVMIGSGALGITISIALFPILTSILLSIVVLTYFKSSTSRSDLRFIESSKKILIASMATWIPAIIYTAGVNLGPIVVLGSHGASQAGVYFIAYSIVAAITAIMTVLSSIAYPALSGMTDGRKRLAWRLTKISMIIAVPFSSIIIFYSKEFMGAFGHSYVDGSSTLGVLLLSMFPTAVFTGISTLAYSYGNYRQVLAIGLASSVPRTILYFILVPLYGGLGAAISYTVGSILGLIMSLVMTRRIGMKIIWKDALLILFIPTGFAFTLSYFEINYLISIIVELIASYVLFLKLGVITRFDLQDSLGILPNNIGNRALNLLNMIGKKLNKSY